MQFEREKDIELKKETIIRNKKEAKEERDS